jgi:hypothetical protein
MSEPVRIDEQAWYDDAALNRELGLAFSALARARKSGELRFTRRGGFILYLGSWVQIWLTADEARREVVSCA